MKKGIAVRCRVWSEAGASAVSESCRQSSNGVWTMSVKMG
jgi:hypothetical protein